VLLHEQKVGRKLKRQLAKLKKAKLEEQNRATFVKSNLTGGINIFKLEHS